MLATSSRGNWEEWYTQNTNRIALSQPPVLTLVSRTNDEVVVKIENRSDLPVNYEGINEECIKVYIKWLKGGQWHHWQYFCGNAFRTYSIKGGKSIVVRLRIWSQDADRWECYSLFSSGKQWALIKLYEIPTEHSAANPVLPIGNTSK